MRELTAEAHRAVRKMIRLGWGGSGVGLREKHNIKHFKVNLSENLHRIQHFVDRRNVLRIRSSADLVDRKALLGCHWCKRRRNHRIPTAEIEVRCWKIFLQSGCVLISLNLRSGRWAFAVVRGRWGHTGPVFSKASDRVCGITNQVNGCIR